ncbi:MAG: DUF5703 domain-containing protein [Cyclobacteriaceae bacterium]
MQSKIDHISKVFYCSLFSLISLVAFTQPKALDAYNVIWKSQSKNSSESMPVGGGDIGLNVWVEGDEVMFYIARSGTFDENNALLKLGRVRLKISPNPFENGSFSQTLNLSDGNILVSATNSQAKADLKIWVDVFNPLIHTELISSNNTTLEASYESWRYEDRTWNGRENNANSYKWRGKDVVVKKDNIEFKDDGILFYHQNGDSTIFDLTVVDQKMDMVKDEMYNPIANLTFGGCMYGPNFKQAGTYENQYMETNFKAWKLVSEKPAKKHNISIALHTEQSPDISIWKQGLKEVKKANIKTAKAETKTQNWWHQYWDRSYIFIDRNEQDSVWQTGRNYQLFRYMLGCNAFGSSPTKFNGGLFTYDPSEVNVDYSFTPDFRNWGGGTHTAQNQRLVYFPMLKSGDFDLMIPQFDFYLNALKNAELRSQQYWGHEGACFTEQLENFGLPNYAEYGSKRPENFDPGLQYNAWLEHQWDTVLEFCLMILETENYAGNDISKYIPLIESSLTFFDEHYQYLARQRGRKSLDENGDLVLYPGSSCETYKMAYNATSTVAALQVVLEKLLSSPYLTESKKDKWEQMLERIPPLELGSFEEKKTIAPAKLWERINNTEAPQLYPVFPWGIYGVGKPSLDIAINTYKLDPDVQKFKTHIGWKQYNIWAARLGLTDEAAKITTEKLKDSGRRFPAFWGPGFDWVPDHNWGGSGAIGLQEMLLQTNGDQILLFPAWPKEWDGHFKLHAPQNTIIEAEIKDGKANIVKITPDERKGDIINLLNEK